MALQPASSGGAVERAGSGTLADVINTILDKGLVIDVYARVSLVGIEILRIDARVVVASVDTYLRFAEAVNRLELSTSEPAGLPGLVNDMQTSGARSKTKGVLSAAQEKLEDIIDSDAEEDEEEERVPRRKREESSR
jgi:hypothetical protein